MMTQSVSLLSLLLHFLLRPAVSFVNPARGGALRPVSQHNVWSDHHHVSMTLTTTNFLVSAVPTFDGSTITNPVVTSSSYWSNLQSQLASLVLGQFVAILVFAIVASVVAQQLPGLLEQLGDFVALQIFRENEASYSKLKVPTPERPNNSPGKQQTGISVDLQKLAVCIAIDIFGSANELIPIYGELIDVIYAPLAAYLLRNAFGGSNVAFAVEFAEEILPFTDILPFATICWLIDTFGAESSAARILQLGNYKPLTNRAASQPSNVSNDDTAASSRIIDVDIERQIER